MRGGIHEKGSFNSGFILFCPIAFAFSADARPGGCLKGAIVGGVAGHFVGHGGIGAAAGCAYGMHRRKTYDRENGYDGRSGYEQRGGKASTGAIE
jgi:hypothetical protein